MCQHVAAKPCQSSQLKGQGVREHESSLFFFLSYQFQNLCSPNARAELELMAPAALQVTAVWGQGGGDFAPALQGCGWLIPGTSVLANGKPNGSPGAPLFEVRSSFGMEHSSLWSLSRSHAAGKSFWVWPTDIFLVLLSTAQNLKGCSVPCFMGCLAEGFQSVGLGGLAHAGSIYLLEFGQYEIAQ